MVSSNTSSGHCRKDEEFPPPQAHPGRSGTGPICGMGEGEGLLMGEAAIKERHTAGVFTADRTTQEEQPEKPLHEGKVEWERICIIPAKRHGWTFSNSTPSLG